MAVIYIRLIGFVVPWLASPRLPIPISARLGLFMAMLFAFELPVVTQTSSVLAANTITTTLFSDLTIDASWLSMMSELAAGLLFGLLVVISLNACLWCAEGIVVLIAPVDCWNTRVEPSNYFSSRAFQVHGLRTLFGISWSLLMLEALPHLLLTVEMLAAAPLSSSYYKLVVEIGASMFSASCLLLLPFFFIAGLLQFGVIFCGRLFPQLLQADLIRALLLVLVCVASAILWPKIVDFSAQSLAGANERIKTGQISNSVSNTVVNTVSNSISGADSSKNSTNLPSRE